MTDALDVSLNTSKKTMYCNHCMTDFPSYDSMKEHYRSELHKYNLNRVTMNLNPLSYSEYLKKKELYQKKLDEANKGNLPQQDSKCGAPVAELKCEICYKNFGSKNTYYEHMNSKSHKKNDELAKSKQNNQSESTLNKMVVDDKTTLDDCSICLFCNLTNESLEKNLLHMVDKHQLDIPLLFCVKNYKGLIRLLAKKIFKYGACITCDSQKFKNPKSLQNHMIDKQHTKTNNEDLEEFLYKFYDMERLLSIKDEGFRKMREFQILKLKLKIAKNLKSSGTEKHNDDEGWETVSEEEEDDKGNKVESKTKKAAIQLEEDDDNDEDFEPIKLPNGELLLENGTVLGNKIYQIYYKQRVHLSRYEKLQESLKVQMKRTNTKRLHGKGKFQKPKLNYFSVLGSNKGSFKRVNTLFKALKQVNV